MKIQHFQNTPFDGRMFHMCCHFPPASWKRPREPRQILKLPAATLHHPVIFSVILMLNRLGLWYPKKREDNFEMRVMLAEFKKTLLAPKGFAEDDDIWPLLDSAGVTREHADEAVCNVLPACLYGLNLLHDGTGRCAFDTQRRECKLLCEDPALTLGILARTKADFYKADVSPDYSIQHLLGHWMVFSDSSLSGKSLEPRWRTKKNPATAAPSA